MVSFEVLALVLSLLAIQTGRVGAQTASCKSGWGWMNNTVGENPCQIAASLDTWCLNTQLIVEPIGPGIYYAPPDDAKSQWAVCDCNSPMYTLYSACAACQGAGWVKWSEWIAVCSGANVGKRPDSFLVTTPIPHWAFINVTINDTFVPGAAKAEGGLPEQREDGPTTTFLPTGSSTLVQVSSTPSVSSTSSSSSNSPSATNAAVPKSKPPVGAIAGGAVGGFAALCLIGFGMLFLHKRGSLKIPRIRKASGPMSLFDPQEGKPSFGTEEAVAVRRPLLYDPSNPATFSQVRAELERPLHASGGIQDPMGYYDPYYPPQPSSSGTRPTIV